MYLDTILLSDDIVKSINDNLDYLISIIPEIKPMINFDQMHPHHHLDLWEHTLLALKLSKNDLDVRLTLLFHDIGKVEYKDIDENGVRHYKNHAVCSANITNDILKRLGYEDGYIAYICNFIIHHDTPITDDEIINDYDNMLKLYEIQRCDGLAHNPLYLEKRKKYLDDIELKLSARKR